MAHIKKRHIILGIISLIILTGLFFLSTFTKNWLVKNSEKLIGRKLEIGELHFDYAKVAIQVKDLVLYEKNKTDSFASFKELYINFDPWTLPTGEYSFSEIRLINPRLSVIQDGEKFNFGSLIPKEDSLQVKDTTKNEDLKFTIRNIQLVDGNLEYTDVQKNNQLKMKNLNLNLPLIAWNNEQSNMGLDFHMGEKGQVKVQAVVDNLNKKYRINLSTENIELNPVTSYLTDYIDIQSLNGSLTSNLKIVGDMNEVIDISISGNASVSDLSMIDGRSEKIISLAKVTATLNDINLKTNHYKFGKIEAIEPNLMVRRDKEMTNLERFTIPYFFNDSINAASGTITSTNETPVTYSIDTIKVTNGLIYIKDNTLNRPFSYELNELNVMMTGLTESADQIPVIFSTKLNNGGQFSGKTVWSMLDPTKLEMDAKMKRMDLLSISPYSEYFIASPITQGWLSYDISLKMTPKLLINENKVKMDELEFGKRTNDITAMKVPARLALYLMKDAKDIISFELPVTGNPSEPQFKLGKIIWKTFVNLMVKTALSPFNTMSGLAGTNPESLKTLPFTFAQDSLDQQQRGTLSRLATIMKKKPDLILTLSQSTDPEKEKQQIAIQLTKNEYIKTMAPDSNATIAANTEVQNDDPKLLAFIRKTVTNVDSIGFENACNQLVNANSIESRFQTILKLRNSLVTDFFTQEQGIPTESIIVLTNDLKNLPQELRIPQYKVEVSVK